LKQAVSLSRYLVFFALAAFVCAADLATKNLAFARLGFPNSPSLPSAQPWWIWEGVFGFQTNVNMGALFGMGQGLWPLFAALSVGAAIGILVWLFPARAAHDWLLTIALSFVTGGILGNLYDRLGLPGLTWPADWPGHAPGETVHAVRDFILVLINGWSWPTFNLADSSLVCGAALLVYHAFFGKKDAEEQGPIEAQSAAR
jgi:signal peptidase II